MKNAAARIWEVYLNNGTMDYIGEPVSQWEHALQSAQLAYQEHPEDEAFVLAAFLHDIGHLIAPTDGMDGFGAHQHENIGANFIREAGLTEKIAALIAGHVKAKRYLVSTDPNYFNALSDASKITLLKQGGQMTEQEAHAFEADPLFELHLQLRRIDERAKLTDAPEDDAAWIRAMLERQLS